MLQRSLDKTSFWKKERKRFLEKFTKLVEHTEFKEKNKHDWNGANKLCNEVDDLTYARIHDDVKAYLSLGPDFSATPKRLPYEKIIIQTEIMCKIIEDEGESQPKRKQELER